MVQVEGVRKHRPARPSLSASSLPHFCIASSQALRSRKEMSPYVDHQGRIIQSPPLHQQALTFLTNLYLALSLFLYTLFNVRRFSALLSILEILTPLLYHDSRPPRTRCSPPTRSGRLNDEMTSHAEGEGRVEEVEEGGKAGVRA